MKTIRTVLIEDNPGDARIIREMLSNLDGVRFDITVRESLGEGITFLDKHDADVVLLDLGLPDSQGMDTLKSIQQQVPLMPVVVLTGLKDEQLAIETASEGAQDYLVKGDISSDVMAHVIRYAMERKKIERRMSRMNSLLRAIRDINQLIVRETDPEIMVTDACTFLARVSGYHHVRIFLTDETDETGEARMGVCAGRDGTQDCTEKDVPICMKKAMAEGDMVTVETLGEMCSDCPWSESYDEAYTAITVPLSYLGNIYGALSVFIPAERQTIEEEEGLFQEAADDLAFALYDLELEEKHRRAEEKYRLLAENAIDVIWKMDLDMQFTYLSSSLKELTGYSPEEWIGNRPTEHAPPEEARKMQQAVAEYLEQWPEQDHARFESAIICRNGSRIPVEITGKAIVDEDGKPVGLQGTTRDITERKQAEQELEERELKLRTLFEETPNPILVANMEGVHVDANRAALDFLECDMETFRETTAWDWIPPWRLEEAKKEHTPFDEPRTLETYYYVNGRVKTLLLNVVPLTVAGEKLMYGIGQDITQRKRAEEKLKKSEEKYRTLFETMEQGVVYQDSEGNIISANPAAERILGLSLDEMQGKTSMDPRWKAVDADGNELRGEQHPAMVALKTGETVEGFVQGIYNPEKNGYVWIIVNSIPQFKEESDEPYQVYSTFLDITQRKEAEDALKESEKELMEAQRLANIGNWRWNLETGDLYLSDEMYNVVGLEKNEESLDVANHEKYYTPESWETFQQAIEKAQTTKEPYEIELEVIREKEKNRKVVARGEPLLDEDGEVAGFRGTLQDVTARKQAEQELEEREKKFREIFNNANDAMFLHTLTDDGIPGTFIEVNDVACDMLGYTPEEFMEMSPRDIDDRETAADVPAIMQELLEEGHATFEMRHMAKNGSRIPVEISSHTFTLNGQRLVLSIARDITERKHREKIERTLRQRVEAGLRAGNLAWWEMKLPSGEVIFDDRKAEMLGYAPERFETYEDFTELLHPDDRPAAMQAMRDHLQGRTETYEVEYRIKTREGAYRWFRDIGGIMEKDEATGHVRVIGIVEDITQRKEAQRELAESEEKYRAIVEGSHDAIFIYRGDEFLFVNSRASDITGYTKQELIDMPVWDIIHPDDLDMVKDVHRKWVRGEEAPNVYQARITTKTDDIRHCEFSMTAITYHGTEAAMGAVRDITQQKQAEEERKQALAEMERALDLEKRFKADAAHFFLNPIAIAKGYMELAVEEIPEEPEEKISRAQRAIKRVETVIKNIVEKGEIHE